MESSSCMRINVWKPLHDFLVAQPLVKCKGLFLGLHDHFSTCFPSISSIDQFFILFIFFQEGVAYLRSCNSCSLILCDIWWFPVAGAWRDISKRMASTTVKLRQGTPLRTVRPGVHILRWGLLCSADPSCADLGPINLCTTQQMSAAEGFLRALV